MGNLGLRPLPIFLLACALAVPTSVGAFEFQLPGMRPDASFERITTGLSSGLRNLCDRLQNSRLPFVLPDFCAPPEPPPPPPPVDVCPNVPGNQESGPCADEDGAAEGGTWNGESCDMPPPPPVDVCPNVPGDQENGPCADEECASQGGTWNGTSCDLPPPPILPTLDFSATPSSIIEGDSSTLEWDSGDADSCTASNGWSGSQALDGSLVVSPTITTTYGLECTNADGSISRNITVTVSPPPPAGTGVVITEIMYAPDGTDATHEWIEIKNGSSGSVNFTGWVFFEDNVNHGLTLFFGADAILEPGEFAIIADDAATFLEDFPGSADTVFDSAFVLESPANPKTLSLKNNLGEIVHSVAYDTSMGGNNDFNSLQNTTGGWIGAPPTPGEENASSS